MLRRMSARQWLDWQTYMRLSPIDEERADARSAQIEAAFVNMWRDTERYKDPFPLEHFMLRFGEAKSQPSQERQQTPEEIERVISGWVLATNIQFAEKNNAS